MREETLEEASVEAEKEARERPESQNASDDNAAGTWGGSFPALLLAEIKRQELLFRAALSPEHVLRALEPADGRRDAH